MTGPSDLWPPYGLVVRSGDLTLSAVTDDDLPGLADLAVGGIHAQDYMPFDVPWTRAADLPRALAQYHWGARASLRPESVRVELAVRRDGELVGAQGFSATDFPVTRSAETGSWLGRRFQGAGIGTRMRRAICTLLLDHLGAEEVTSGAWSDNPASLAVSRKVGYRETDRQRRSREGVLAEHVSLRLLPGDLVRGEPIEVRGAEPLRRFLAPVQA